MLTIDDKFKIKPTRILKSLQFRVYREIPTVDQEHPEKFDPLVGKQEFYEFRLTRMNLFAGTTGGLYAVGSRDEEMNAVFPPPLPGDEFEAAPPIQPKPTRIMKFCAGCHSRPGIHSVESYRHSFSRRPIRLEMSTRLHQENDSMREKWLSYSWGLLQGLLERE